MKRRSAGRPPWRGGGACRTASGTWVGGGPASSRTASISGADDMSRYVAKLHRPRLETPLLPGRGGERLAGGRADREDRGAGAACHGMTHDCRILDEHQRAARRVHLLAVGREGR